MSAHPNPIPEHITIAETSLNAIGIHVEHIKGAIHALDMIKETTEHLADPLLAPRAWTAQLVLIAIQCAAIEVIVADVLQDAEEQPL